MSPSWASQAMLPLNWLIEMSSDWTFSYPRMDALPENAFPFRLISDKFCRKRISFGSVPVI